MPTFLLSRYEIINCRFRNGGQKSSLKMWGSSTWFSIAGPQNLCATFWLHPKIEGRKEAKAEPKAAAKADPKAETQNKSPQLKATGS
jgi:hypothetical protein